MPNIINLINVCRNHSDIRFRTTVYEQLSSIVQYLERSLLVLVTSASGLPVRTIKFCSVLFGVPVALALLL